MWELRGSDLAAVIDQLGREPLTTFSVFARCESGHPLVIRNFPVDLQGKPFPTMYWLTCPEAVKAVSRLEADGWIARFNEKAESRTGFADELERAHAEYAEERARWHEEARAWGGVGGTRTGVKCLHAHYANHLAGGADPVGAWVAGKVEPVHPDEERSGRVAAVDMGTNSVRLIVGTPAGDDIKELARDMVITRLGKGVDTRKRLDPAARERTLNVLGRYVRRAHALGAERIRVGCTSAVRDAEDAEPFLEQVGSLAGSPPEVLTGEQEAALSFLGATADIDEPAPFLVFDIGGGSTELVRGEEQPQQAISINVGSVRMTERIAPKDPPTRDDLDAMRALASEALSAAIDVVPPKTEGTLVGVAGTTTTVQALALGLERYDPEAIHLTKLTRRSAEEVTERLASMTTEERRALPVMAAGREDVIVAGCVILLEVMERWGFDACEVSERDILDGLAIEMVRRSDQG